MNDKPKQKKKSRFGMFYTKKEVDALIEGVRQEISTNLNTEIEKVGETVKEVKQEAATNLTEEIKKIDYDFSLKEDEENQETEEVEDNEEV